ncbi:MAG TPA: hypothetical protein QGH64_05215, partial [Candidatus Poseidoniia archaeon]|nr:hypothetical protein [Candidatus Poseidoniia archaeon]
MAEKTDSESDSKEEEIDENEESKGEDSEEIDTEPEESDEEEEESAPIDYTTKLGLEEEEEPKDPYIKRNIKNAINYLDGKSRSVVISALIIFIISIFNFIAWNFTEWETLKYVGTTLAIFLLIACGLGVLISFNVHNVEIKKNTDVRTSGLILSIGSILIALFFMVYEIRENSCLTEYTEISCDGDVSLRAVTTIAVYAGSLGVVMLIYGLGLLERGLVPYALAIAFGGSLILTIVLLMSVFNWIEESVWLLLIPLLFLGMGLAGLHHRRYQLAGFVIGCYIAGLAGIGWLIEPSLASGGFIGGGLPMTGSGLLFILRRTDREARERMLEEAQEFLDTGYPSRSLEVAGRLIRRAQRDGVLMQDSRMWLSKARALTGHREYARSTTYYSMALEIDP